MKICENMICVKNVNICMYVYIYNYYYYYYYYIYYICYIIMYINIISKLSKCNDKNDKDIVCHGAMNHPTRWSDVAEIDWGLRCQVTGRRNVWVFPGWGPWTAAASLRRGHEDGMYERCKRDSETVETVKWNHGPLQWHLSEPLR